MTTPDWRLLVPVHGRGGRALLPALLFIGEATPATHQNFTRHISPTLCLPQVPLLCSVPTEASCHPGQQWLTKPPFSSSPARHSRCWATVGCSVCYRFAATRPPPARNSARSPSLLGPNDAQKLTQTLPLSLCATPRTTTFAFQPLSALSLSFRLLFFHCLFTLSAGALPSQSSRKKAIEATHPGGLERVAQLSFCALRSPASWLDHGPPPVVISHLAPRPPCFPACPPL